MNSNRNVQHYLNDPVPLPPPTPRPPRPGEDDDDEHEGGGGRRGTCTSPAGEQDGGGSPFDMSTTTAMRRRKASSNATEQPVQQQRYRSGKTPKTVPVTVLHNETAQQQALLHQASSARAAPSSSASSSSSSIINLVESVRVGRGQMKHSDSWLDMATQGLDMAAQAVSSRRRPSCLHCYHPHACHVFIARGFLRGALTAVVGKSVLSLAGGLLNKRIRRAGLLRHMQKSLFSYDAFAVTRFLSLLSGTSRLFTCLFTRWWSGHEVFNASLANFVAGFAILTDDPNRRFTVAVYMIVRAFHELWRTWVMKKYVRAPKYAAAYVFALAQGPIMYSFLQCPQALPPAYHAWILRMSNLSEEQIRTIANSDIFEPCQKTFHPDYGCIEYNVRDWFHGLFVRAVPIYLPVFILPPLLFNTKRTLMHPLNSAMQISMNLLKSCAFLASYTTITKYVTCFTRNVFQANHRWTSCFAGFCTGFSLLFENPRRHVELTLYVLPRAIQTALNLIKLWYPKLYRFCKFPGGATLVFAAGCSMLRYATMEGPGLTNFNSVIYRAIFGVPAHTAESMRQRRELEERVRELRNERLRARLARWVKFDFEPSRPPSPSLLGMPGPGV